MTAPTVEELVERAERAEAERDEARGFEALWKDKLHTAEAEVQRLREALAKIAKEPLAGGNADHIARAALSEEPRT